MKSVPDVFEVSSGLRVVPLRTPTLPPATATNTSFVGRSEVWIVDPATPYADQRNHLLKEVDGIIADGRRIRGTVLTHHHADHVGAAVWLKEERQVPVYATARTQELLPPGTVDHTVAQGDVLTGSDAPDDRWHVLETPGHASGHLVLWEPSRRIMVIGDMVAAVGTIVVEPPDGHMSTYLAQLKRLRTMNPAIAVPAHGPVIEDPCGKLDFYVQHRLKREAKVLAAVEALGPASLMRLTARAYQDVPASIHALAARAALAHLVKLEEDGAVMRQGADDVVARALTLPMGLQKSVLWRVAARDG